MLTGKLCSLWQPFKRSLVLKFELPVGDCTQKLFCTASWYVGRPDVGLLGPFGEEPELNGLPC